MTDAPERDERESKQSYDDVSVYPVSDELRARLFEVQTECAVVWSTTDGWPVGVMHRYVWRDGRFWVTTMAHRKRVPALRKRPKSSVIVSGENAAGGWRDFTITAKTMATVHDDGQELKDWFYTALAERMNPGRPERAAAFRDRVDSPGRVIIELEPVKWITYDGAKVAAHVLGRWNPEEEWEDPRL